MIKYLKLISLANLLLFTFSCEKMDNSGEFTNKLTFGISINYNDFSLIGEGNEFSVSPGNVAYRLESTEDFSGNPVKFIIIKDGSVYSTETFSNNPKPSGHIFITILNYTQTGTYSATASIEKTSGTKVVAGGTFKMN